MLAGAAVTIVPSARETFGKPNVGDAVGRYSGDRVRDREPIGPDQNGLGPLPTAPGVLSHLSPDDLTAAEVLAFAAALGRSACSPAPGGWPGTARCSRSTA